MPNLDLPTLIVVSVANLVLASIALLVVATLNTEARGIRRCVGACFLLIAGIAVIPIRPALPVLLGLFLANAPIYAGALLLLDGILAFREFRRPTRPYVGVSIAFLLSFGWFVIHDDVSARVAISAFFEGGLTFLTAVAMAWKAAPRDRAVYWSTAAGFAVHAVSIVARGFIALFGLPFVLYQARPIDFINLATLDLATLGCAFGLAMATNLRLQRKTETLALYDSLTNLPNRRLFEERLEQAGRTRMENQRLALIYCDLDDFKGINDRLGHEGGDEALRVVAGRMRNLMSEDVCLARIGGDEFLVLIENAPFRSDVANIIDRLINGVEGEFEYRRRSAKLRISCGSAIYPDDVNNVSDLIRVADASMYKMKQRGRFADRVTAER